ncbi:LysR family transcriptional regulator [Klebsiella pneumoniae]|uniref:LysR family transcriptional regulator n=1 Tax=Klebsiella pneumoniae TaxID=573 RepID=A0A377UR69_KLEPN|nr:LysR family transcriptional regulator [Klebsiella pneumoniae]
MREELDFKSLRFFSALYRLGNVSPAADALDISQPTGSLLLKKLRDHFADPLFVRVGQRMIPTPRADAIAPTISTLLQLADNDLAVKPEFLPQQSQRNFTIGMTRYQPNDAAAFIANCAPAAGGGRDHLYGTESG